MGCKTLIKVEVTVHKGTALQYVETIGILDTPCFPARYYAGPLLFDCLSTNSRESEFIPGINYTYNFFRTEEEALAELVEWEKMLQNMKP